MNLPARCPCCDRIPQGGDLYQGDQVYQIYDCKLCHCRWDEGERRHYLRLADTTAAGHAETVTQLTAINGKLMEANRRLNTRLLELLHLESLTVTAMRQFFGAL